MENPGGRAERDPAAWPGDPSRQVVVTGLGCLCAAGLTVEDCWTSLMNGGGPPPSVPGRLVKLAGELGLGELSHPAFALPDEAFPDGFRHSARDSLALALRAAGEALAQAGLEGENLAGEGFAVIVGGTAGNALHFLEDYAALKRGRRPEGSGLADFYDCNPAEALAAALKKLGRQSSPNPAEPSEQRRDGGGVSPLRGPALTVGNACCSGADAVGLGLELIASGRCRRVLAGGADALSLVPYVGFRRLMIYSDEPCRPFDRRRRGLNLGEGAGLMLLESAEAAAERGARPLARLLGYAAASDAHHLTAPQPEAAGLRRAIQKALARAGISAAEAAFVNAHGTATPDNDRVEALAVGRELPGAKLWAVKGSTGHCLGAAGGLEAVLTVAALQRGLLPPSHGFAQADPELGLSPTTAPTPFDGPAALSLSLGFGGGNSALVFGRP